MHLDSFMRSKQHSLNKLDFNKDDIMKRIKKYLLCSITSLALLPVYASPTMNHCLTDMKSHIINSDTAWFDECELKDNDMPTLISYLNSHPEITQLYLLNNQIGDEGAFMLAKNKTLKMLELRNNIIGQKGAIALAHSSIHMLDLQGNKFNGPHVVEMAQNTRLNRANNEVIILG